MPTTRTTAKQGSIVRLKIVIRQDGDIADPYSIGTGVDIKDVTDTIVASGISPVKASTGTYYVDYPISAVAPVGTWNDIWNNVVYDSELSSADIILNFNVQLSTWASTAPDACCVYEFILKQGGNPLVGQEGVAKIINLPYSYGNAYYSNYSGGTAYSDSSGKIQWDLVYSAKVNIKIPAVGLNKNFIVPSMPVVQLKDIAAI